MELELDARLERAADRLAVTYTVRNRGTSAVCVVDQMLATAPGGWALDPGGLIVREADDARAVRLVRGFVPPESDVRVVLVPGVRRLPPGGTLEGRAETAWPLRARHPQDGERPLVGARDVAVVEIGVLPGDAPLHPVALAAGGEVEVAPAAVLHEQQRFVASAPLPLAR